MYGGINHKNETKWNGNSNKIHGPYQTTRHFIFLLNQFSVNLLLSIYM